jgi:protein ImuB
MTRIACLLVPDLLVAAELRAHPELRGEPLAIASGPDPRAEVVGVSAEAVRAGVRPLCSVAQARSLCARLHVRVASPAREGAARSALRDVALSASPRIEEVPRASGLHAGEAAVFLDAAGIDRLFGSEAGFAGALLDRAGRLGLPAAVALAGSRSVALVAARSLALDRSGDVEIVPSGADARFLAPLPLDLLAPGADLAGALGRLGVRRLGELARLPAAALATRLGPAALELRALARGEAREPPLAPVRDACLEEASDLESPVESLEPLAFVLRGILSRLLERLEVRGLACGDLSLSLALLGGGSDDRRLGLAAPTLELRTVLRLVLLSVEERPPPAPVERVAVRLEGRAARRDQLDLFRPAGPAPARLERLLAELEVLCGRGRVGAPRVLDDWRPHAFDLGPFAPGSGSALAGARPARSNGSAPAPGDRARTSLAVRALRPPLPAQVQASLGRPERVRSALANGRVVRAAGPWRTSGGWWCPERRFAFDHFDVETEDGLVVRLRLDRITGRWEIDALYD